MNPADLAVANLKRLVGSPAWPPQFLDMPGDSHTGPPRNLPAAHPPIPVGTPVVHAGHRGHGTIVGVDGPYPDGTWEYQVLEATPLDGTHGPKRPRWWPERAVR